jgi:hypothetical protein
LGVQIAEDLLSENPQGWSSVDWVQVGVATGAGATGAGILTNINRARRLGRIGQAVANRRETIVDVSESVVTQLAEGDGVSITETAADVLLGGYVGKRAGDRAEALADASPEQALRRRQADRAERLANRPNARQSRIDAADAINEDIADHGAQAGVRAGLVSGGVAGTGVEVLCEAARPGDGCP